SPVAKDGPFQPVLQRNSSLPLSDATCLAYEQEGLSPDGDQCALWRALVSLLSGLSGPLRLSLAWSSMHVLPFLRYHAHQKQPVPREAASATSFLSPVCTPLTRVNTPEVAAIKAAPIS
ncbi:hypothetical protein JMJ77_0012968, partial [Colletotrichum scovillei]